MRFGGWGKQATLGKSEIASVQVTFGQSRVEVRSELHGTWTKSISNFRNSEGQDLRKGVARAKQVMLKKLPARMSKILYCADVAL